ncbi:hypothetical protein DPEC_G00021440 [Dallia pectoralis]|uniref:Uncharacterized protein n=1 Tax=Dallia pectoralis TaxID=75939 RepID=A0ACC2HG74_DALPE|nr:hypothetical protein DPEC_G00021440 [Dallia pectoralis]
MSEDFLTVGGRSVFLKPVPSDLPDSSWHAEQPIVDPCPSTTTVSQPETNTILVPRNRPALDSVPSTPPTLPDPAKTDLPPPPPPVPSQTSTTFTLCASSSTTLPPPSLFSPDVSSQRPTTLALKTLPRGSMAKENGGPPSGVDEDEEERKMMEEDLKKCIEDFRKIKLPNVFPDKKRHWQSDLLKKYNA